MLSWMNIQLCSKMSLDPPLLPTTISVPVPAAKIWESLTHANTNVYIQKKVTIRNNQAVVNESMVIFLLCLASRYKLMNHSIEKCV
mmetsp:Transcript_24245/g.52295  ORF Transcript_24245/g.52295 Transcript_24245/m.52295 type:complete len:86 (+) Transcript_24245:793-1050(+)